MRDADAFEATVFLGLARGARRDPYRLALFGEHLAADERPLVFLPIQGGTLLVTDRRVLELRAHLEVHGAWNVKEFQGYAIEREIDRAVVQAVDRSVRPTADGSGTRRVEDRLLLTTSTGSFEVLVSRGPELTWPDAELRTLRDAVLGPHAK